MKKIFTFFIFIIFFSASVSLNAEDALTIKQQLDRIMEEVKDLNKAVFNKSFDKNDIYSNIKENDTERFTSIDIRMYDLEKDIKNLTLQFEEILFKLDDLSDEINSLENETTVKLEKMKINLQTQNMNKNETQNSESKTTKEENTLGKLVISNNSQSSNDIDSENLVKNNKKNQQNEELDNLSAEEQLQFALDQMMKKNYDKSKQVLENFITKFSQNQLAGSAHYWLGKIYLFESNYRKAAIIFGEGVQKFPKSIKAAEMYYELAKSLKEMNKIPEACKTLTLLEENYQGSKFTTDPEKIKNDMSC